MDWQILLITVYDYVHTQFNRDLCVHCLRFSNNDNKPELTDEEVITIFLYGIMRKRLTVRDIYDHTCEHLSDWLPFMPSYKAFVRRLNRVSGVFPVLTDRILSDFSGTEIMSSVRLIDSFPVIMANGKRRFRARVAPDVANIGRCPSKGIHYYGVKVHVLGISRPGTLPLPDYIGVAPASNHDLRIFKEITPYLSGCQVYADKAYVGEVEKQFLRERGGDILTPVKKKKGQKDTPLGLFDSLFSKGVSRVRQPVESLFNWIHEKTGIQTASKVRSSRGLEVHVFGRLAAAMFMLVFGA